MNWILSVAAYRSDQQCGHTGRNWGCGRLITHPGAVLAVGTWFGLARYRISVASSGIAFPVAFIGLLPKRGFSRRLADCPVLLAVWLIFVSGPIESGCDCGRPAIEPAPEIVPPPVIPPPPVIWDRPTMR